MIFRKITFASVMLAAVALGGCATNGTIPPVIGGTTPPVQNDITNAITQVQNAAVLACGFLPTATTVANIIGTLTGVGPATQAATTIAAQICAAVVPAHSGKHRGAPVVRVHGKTIAVHGHFVK